MNQQTFDLGYSYYQAGDWATAVAYFMVAKEPGELAGRVDHLLGNCYMKLGRYDDAAKAYGAALADRSYGMVGALNTNRGRALVAAGRLQEAVEALRAATTDATYATPYKAYTALGGACRALGDVRGAGIAYRNAAIDDANPDPSMSLRKLGGCFMDLGRPADAVESYRTALDFAPNNQGKNAVYCDLALAYMAANKMSEAVDAFDHATADGGYRLSPESQAAYDAAKNAVAARSGVRRPSDTDNFLASAGYGSYPVDPLDPTGETSGNLMPSPEDTGFFSVSEEELVKDDRARRRGRGGKIVAVILVLLLILGASAGFAYYSGFGWPTQESVVEGLFTAKRNHDDVGRFVSDALDEESRQNIMSLVPADTTGVTINGVDRAMSTSTVLATAQTAEGSGLRYTIGLLRDGIGWKVNSFKLEYDSLEGDATMEEPAPVEESAPEGEPVPDAPQEEGVEEGAEVQEAPADTDDVTEGTTEL